MDDKGNVGKCVMHYRVKTDGHVKSNDFHTVSVKSKLSMDVINKIVKDSIESTETSEKIIGVDNGLGQN